MRLLIDVGANLEAHDCHFGTPLHVACAREHLDCVKVLLNAGMSAFLPALLRVGVGVYTCVPQCRCFVYLHRALAVSWAVESDRPALKLALPPTSWDLGPQFLYL